MKIYTIMDAFQELCKSMKKWGMYISSSCSEEFIEEMPKAAPYLSWEEHPQIIMDGNGILLFDTEKEMWHHYDMTVGDDGPTKLNKYKGHTRVYALTCDPDGQLLTENT